MHHRDRVGVFLHQVAVVFLRRVVVAVVFLRRVAVGVVFLRRVAVGAVYRSLKTPNFRLVRN